jgi:hypothetical protein
MSKSTLVRSAKIVGAVAAGVMITTSIGSASAAPSADRQAPATIVAEPAPVTAAAPAAAPASSRGSLTGAAADAQAASASARRPSRQVSARQALAAQQAKFAAFTTKSKATRDMRGIEKSLYRGKYYNATAESRRLCIVERESEGFYDVVNPGGNYFGAYQVSRDLARGATWMMLKEHKKLMGEKAAKKTLASLRAKPMNTWPRYWQDAAFHTVINWERPLSGASHWAGGRWHC